MSAPEEPKAIAKKEKPIDTVRAALELLKPQFQMALPKHLTPERLCRVVVTQVQRTPKLLECDRISLYAAVMTAAQLGLEPDGILGHLVPYGKRVQFIADYKGLLSLARNSGEVDDLMAQAVHAKDFFEFEYGINHRLVHRPATGDRGDIVAFYAYAHMRGGGFHFEVMTRSEVDAVRDGSAGYRNALKYAKAGEPPDTPWVNAYPEMGRKTLIRRVSKYLPRAVQKAAVYDELVEAGKAPTLGEAGELLLPEDVVDVEVEPSQNGEVGAPTGSRMDQLAAEAAAAARKQTEGTEGTAAAPKG